MGVVLLGALAAWVAILAVVVAACWAAAHGDAALLAARDPRACERRRRRAIGRLIARVHS